MHDEDTRTPEDTREVVTVPDDARRAFEAKQAALARPTAKLAEPMSSDEMQAWWRLADAMANSGAFKQTDAALAFVKITLGRDLGLGPAQAMMSLDVVKGNLQMRGVLLGSFVRRAPDYDYEVVHSDAERCLVRFYGIGKRTGEWDVLGESEFTIEDAKQAKLVKDDSAWKAHPRNMLLWRALSNGVKFYCPDLLGGVPVYTEADDFREIPAIGAAESDEAPGWRGVSVAEAAEVEKVVRRAQKLGHAGLSNLAAAQMALNDQPRETVSRWIVQAHKALDRFVAETQHPPLEDADDDTLPATQVDHDHEDAREALSAEEVAQGLGSEVAQEPDGEQIPFSDPGGVDVPPKVKREKKGGE